MGVTISLRLLRHENSIRFHFTKQSEMVRFIFAQIFTFLRFPSKLGNSIHYLPTKSEIVVSI